MRRVLPFLALLALAAPVQAGSFSPVAGPSWTPRTPVSAFARPSAWIDPSRLHFSNTVTVGSGFGSGTQALNVTRLDYRFNAPAWLSVGVGQSFGGSRRTAAPFLESLAFGFQPSANSFFKIEYRNMRSPLQYGPGDEFGFWGR